MARKIQNEDVKSLADLTGAGGSSSQLLNTDKMYSPKSAEVLETTLRKNKDDATVDPTVDNDTTEGYEVGSRWTNTADDKVFMCLDATDGAAVWRDIGATGEAFEFTTKFLTANFTTNTEMTDLRFTGLTVGANYMVMGQFYYDATGTSVQVVSCADQSANTIFTSIHNPFANDNATQFPSVHFTAQDTEVRFTVSGQAGGSQIFGDNTRSRTFVTLIKIPEIAGGAGGSSDTAWAPWASAPTGSWTTNATYTGLEKQSSVDEKSYQVEINLSGANTQGVLTVNLPAGDVIDTSKLVGTSTQMTILGQASVLNSGVAVYMGRVKYENTTSVRLVTFRPNGNDIDTISINSSSNDPHTFKSGDSIVLEFTVPIVGL